MRPPFEDPAALLLQADGVLQAVKPQGKACFSRAWGGNVLSYQARFDYPGIVSVFDRNTGELIARSKPGQPTKLATPWGSRASR